MAQMDTVFERFLDRLGYTQREFLTQALNFVNEQNPELYRTYRWPKRADAEPVHRPEPDVMVPLERRADEITSALVELEIAPDHLVEGRSRHGGLRWDEAESLGTYATTCLTQYTEKKATARIHREFLTCMITMAYSCTMDALHQISLDNGVQSVDARRRYFQIRRDVKKSTHDRLMRIGRRSLELVTVFRNLSALAILGPYRLSIIDKMGTTAFDDFVTLLRGEVRRREPTAMNIRNIRVDHRLIYLYGLVFPPQLHPYLPTEPTPGTPGTPDRPGSAGSSGSSGGSGGSGSSGGSRRRRTQSDPERRRVRRRKS